MYIPGARLNKRADRLDDFQHFLPSSEQQNTGVALRNKQVFMDVFQNTEVL